MGDSRTATPMTSRPDGSFQQQPPIRPHVPPVPPQGSEPPEGTGRWGGWWAVLLIVALIINLNGMLSEEQDDTGDVEGSREVEVVSSGRGSGFDWRACRYGSAIPFNLPDPSLNRMMSQITRPDGKFNENRWTRGVDELHSSKRYCSPWIHGGEGIWSTVYRAYRDGGIQLSGLNYRCNWSSSRNTYVCKLL